MFYVNGHMEYAENISSRHKILSFFLYTSFSFKYSVIDSTGIFLLINETVIISCKEIYQNEPKYNEEGFLVASTKNSRDLEWFMNLTKK